MVGKKKISGKMIFLEKRRFFGKINFLEKFSFRPGVIGSIRIKLTTFDLFFILILYINYKLTIFQV